MGNSELYSIISKCFAPVDLGLWDEITGYNHWSTFLESCRTAILEDGDGRPRTAAKDAEKASSEKAAALKDFLSSREIDALYRPPTFEEKKLFAARHFTGGLPDSACPVESLYTNWVQDPGRESPFGQTKGLYLGDSAWYMQDLIERLGMKVPPEYRACPDHLSLELDLLAVLERSGFAVQAEVFLTERFQWLTAYRTRLLQVADDARFYIGLIDVMIGIYSEKAMPDEAS